MMKTTVERQSYYHGTIPEGSVGVLRYSRVPRVRLRQECKCKTFDVIDFGEVRGAYHAHEYKKLPEVTRP
jgi:hypothetical protein